MLANMLEKALTKSHSRCAVSKWLEVQDEKVNEIFNKVLNDGSINYQEFYSVIKTDAESKGEATPFAITTMRNHLQSRCSCLKIGK
jgi:hypothetical protein